MMEINANRITADHIIHQFELVPHPEGGHYREIYRSPMDVLSPVNGHIRHAVTEIYFLLKKGEKSRFHEVLHDEIWHFYTGDSIRLITFDGEKTEEVALGPGLNCEYVHIVPGKTYQAAESFGEYSFVGCTVAPGFDFDDFRFLNQDAEKIANLPNEYHEFI